MARPSLPRWLQRPEETLAVILLVLVFASIALQVVTRFILRDPLFWTEEAARYLFVWLVGFGSAELIRARAHIAMDAFSAMLPDTLRRPLNILLNLLVLAALVILLWYGWSGALRANRVMSVALGVPESALYAALPVSAALMALRCLQVIAHHLGALRRREPIAIPEVASSERFL